MIGSPDLVAFTRENAEDEVDDVTAALGGVADSGGVPEEFSLPPPPPNPWSRTANAKFPRDFILVSEFSEQVGPQPLLTVPADASCGSLDLNYFSLRLMSVDYQASFVAPPAGPAPGGPAPPRLSFVEDSRVVLGDSKEGAFAYVHHLTLYDLEARGFVRPFCLAYVANDQSKIMTSFTSLARRFSLASECLKAGNRRAFANELNRKLRDLEYTRSVLQEEEGLQRGAGPQSRYSAHAVEKANELANVERSIFEHRDLLRQIASYRLRPRRDPHAAPCPACLRDCDDVMDPPANQTPPHGEDGREEEGPRLVKAKAAKCFDKRLKTLQELCHAPSYHAALQLLRRTHRSFHGDLCYLHTRRLERALRRKLTITNFLFEDYDDEEEEGGALTVCCPVNHHLDNHILLKAPPIILRTDPDAAEPLESPGHAPDNGHTGDGELGAWPLDSSPSDQLSSERSGAGPEEEEPSDSAHNDPERESSSEEAEPMAGEEDGGDQTPLSLLEAEQDGIGGVDDVDVVSSVGGGAELLVPLDAACCITQEGFLYEASDASLASHRTSPLATVVDQEPQALPPPQDDYAVGWPCSGGSAPSLELPAGDAEDDHATSGSTGSDGGSALGSGGVSWLRQRKRAGQSALRFIRQYPFAITALSVLLSGRTLVVLGADRGRVQRLVNALALYLPRPGSAGERVNTWMTSPLSVSDLQRWKLIGLQRVASPAGHGVLYSLSRYSRYVSVLDSDQKTLRCPPYAGRLLANMADHRTGVRRGSTYFLHLQSVLSRLAARAFLLAFTHHLHLPLGGAGEDGTHAAAARRHAFLTETLGLSQDDAHILTHLSRLVAQHYLPPHPQAPPTFPFSYTASVLHKI